MLRPRSRRGATKGGPLSASMASGRPRPSRRRSSPTLLAAGRSIPGSRAASQARSYLGPHVGCRRRSSSRSRTLSPRRSAAISEAGRALGLAAMQPLAPVLRLRPYRPHSSPISESPDRQSFTKRIRPTLARSKT
jgi:hypothetical protein